ncbi:MAG: TolC family protein [Marinoscillum sp.]
MSLIALLGSISTCSPELTPVELTYDSLEGFSRSGNVAMNSKWWRSFEDTDLNLLIDSALADNFSLAATWQQLRAAQASVTQARSGLFPQVDLNLRSGISRPKPDFVGGENTQLSLGASYEVDLWGRIRYAAHAEEYRKEATRFAYKTAAISLAGELAITWFRLKAANEQLGLLEQQISTNQKTLALIRIRFGSGQVRGVDILRQQQLIASSEEQKIILETDIATLKNQMAILLGQPPTTIDLDSNSFVLPKLPPLPKTGVPLQLVNRRPDVQQTYYQLQASDREVAAAISAKYPRLNLSVAAAIRSNDINNLLQSQAVSLTGGLLAPLFYGGRLNAAVDEAKAIREQQISNYAQAVLVAFREVEDALVREQKQQERLVVIRERLDLTQRANSQLKTEYLNGSLQYLDVLTGLNQEQQLQQELVMAKLALLEIRISLYRALAGGFETERENQEDQS